MIASSSGAGAAATVQDFWALILAAILVGGFALMVAATWYTHRRR